MSFTIGCRRCGALNDASFRTCIRCAAPLDGGHASPPVRAPSARRGSMPFGRGSEPLLGKWPPEELPVAKALLTLTMLVFGLQ
ncbi:MAG: hypothetical protein FJ095_14415, partial [Deltaproteobacteria bacterium]|nr:hypothetical protein [Deltaproteobacteria bacterium]